MENTENMEMNEINEEKEIAGESKADKFKRIGQSRVVKALEAIQRLGALSGSSYEYTDEQVENMFGALQSKLDETRDKFKKEKKKEKPTFTF